MSIAGLNLEYASFNGCGPAQSPKQRRKPQHELSFNRRLSIKVCRHRQLERRVILCILQALNNGFRSEPMAHSIAAGPLFPLFGGRASALFSIAPISFDLSRRGHDLRAVRLALLCDSLDIGTPIA